MKSNLKTGYHFRKQLSRINKFIGKPEKLYTYCSKYTIGKRPPSLNAVKGVLGRTFSLIVYFGNPKYHIKEISSPTETGGKEYEKLYNELNEIRNLLIIYRVSHFKDAIPKYGYGYF